MYKRVYSIDYLRGILALFIVIYHYSSWGKLINVNTNCILFRLALYGVSIFFIISGFSLTYVYKDRLNSYEDILKYLRNRIARIYPLFIFVIIFAILINFRTLNDLKTFLQQVTISFYFFNKGALTPGGWSIGVEIMFYLIFPILILLNKFYLKFRLFYVNIYLFLIVFCMFLSMYYNNYYYKMGDKYFLIYVHNFFNHFYFFLGGMLIAYEFNTLKNILFKKFFKRFFITFSIVLVLLFLFLKVNNQYLYEYYIVLSGKYRLLFSIFSFSIFLFVLIFFTRNIALLNFLGKISYTLYLTHPLSFYLLSRYLKINYINIFVYILFALLFSSIVYFFYELPMKKIIRNFKVY